MNHANYLHTRSPVQVNRSSWVLLLFITVVSLLSYHDLSHAKNSIGDYNASQDQLIAYVSDGSLTHRLALVMLGVVSIVSLARYRGPGRLHINGSLGWSVISFAACVLTSPTSGRRFTLGH